LKTRHLPSLTPLPPSFITYLNILPLLLLVLLLVLVVTIIIMVALVQVGRGVERDPVSQESGQAGREGGRGAV